MNLESQYKQLGISPEVYAYGVKTEESLAKRFAAIDKTAEFCQMKVIAAMQKNRVSAECFEASTGYGYNDLGRDTLEAVYADCFHTESALVRAQITCGTHALALEQVIGIHPAKGSLAEFGITYRQVELLPDGSFDYDAIRAAINERTKLIEIQRSKGYLTRPTFSVEAIGELIAFIKSVKPDVICMVDNCYGEFVEEKEPSDVGADLVVGSLIKNPGGGLAPIGGYIVGKSEYVEQCAYRLTSPGLGRDTLEAVYADCFHTESALVRAQITCGTHALASGRKPRGQLCDAGTLGDARIPFGCHHGGRHLHSGSLHRALRRRSH